MDRLIDHLLKHYGEEIRHARTDRFIMELMALAQRDPRLKCGPEKLHFVANCFTETISRIWKNNALFTVMQESIQDEVAAAKALFNHSLPPFPVIDLPKKESLEKQAYYLYVGYSRDWIAKENIAPLVYSLYQKATPSLIPQIAYHVLERIYPNYKLDEKENALFIACYTLIPTIYALYDRASQ